MVFIVNRPWSIASFLTSGTIQMLVGSVTSFKIWRSEQEEGKWFGLSIAICVFGTGASLVAEVFCIITFREACQGHYTLGGRKAFEIIDAFWFLSQSHFWIFAVEYLQTGIKYSQVNSVFKSTSQTVSFD